MKRIESFPSWSCDPFWAVWSRITAQHRERQRRQVHRDRTTASSFPPFFFSPDHYLSRLRNSLGLRLRPTASIASLFSSSTMRQGHACPCACLREISPGCGATKDRWWRDWEQGRHERSLDRQFSFKQEIARINPCHTMWKQHLICTNMGLSFPCNFSTLKLTI